MCGFWLEMQSYSFPLGKSFQPHFRHCQELPHPKTLGVGLFVSLSVSPVVANDRLV